MRLHVRSSYHLKMMGQFNQNPNSATGAFSHAFEKEFSDLFRTKYGYNKQIPINKIYNDLIHDKSHTHLNSTHFKSLNGFAAYLGGGSTKFNLEW